MKSGRIKKAVLNKIQQSTVNALDLLHIFNFQRFNATSFLYVVKAFGVELPKQTKLALGDT